MNGYVKQFIIDNYENVLGPSVFMMMQHVAVSYHDSADRGYQENCSFGIQENELVKAFLSKAKENMQLIEEHQRCKWKMLQ